MMYRRWLDMLWLVNNWHVIVSVGAVRMIHLMHVLFMMSRQEVRLVHSAFRSAIAVFIILRLLMNRLFVI